MNNKIIVFEISANKACFKYPETLTTQISYNFPLKSTIIGLLASLVGLKTDEYLSKFNNKVKIGVKILRKISKDICSYNYYFEKNSSYAMPSRTHRKISFQYIRNPKYRIYFLHEDKKLYEELLDRIKEGRSVFIPYLGKRECIVSNIDFICYSDFEKVVGECEISSVLDRNLIKKEDLIYKEQYKIKESVYREMQDNREATDYTDYIYTDDLTTIEVKNIKEAYYIKDIQETITFL